MLFRRFFVFALAGAVVAGFAGRAPAGEPLPFHGSLEGTLVSRTPLAPGLVFDHFEVSGTGTQLGQFDLVIEAVVDFRSLPVTGEGTVTFTAANGDVLVAEIMGSSALVVPGLVLITEDAIIDPDNSTGRFAGAAGFFTVERLADAATGVNGDGWILRRNDFVGNPLRSLEAHRA